MAKRLLLLIGISLAIAAWPIADSAEEIAPFDLVIMFVAFAAVLAVQCAALLIIKRFASERLTDILVTLFVAANAYHFALLTLEASTPSRLFFAALTGGVAWLLLNVAVPSAMPLLFALVFTSLSLGRYAYGRASLADETQAPAFTPLSIPVKSDRNVYLISMESLHSPSAMRELYGIEAPPHVEYLKAEGFRVLDRAYSVDTSTRRSYKRLLEFSKPLDKFSTLAHVFRTGNSTLASFKEGGYRVQFIYINNYMNWNPKLLDHLYPRVGFYVCDNVPNNFFYFICRQSARTLINKHFFGVKHAITVPEEIAHLKERIATINADDERWLTISHIAFPMHTKMTHNYKNTSEVDEFRELYRSFMPQVAENYREIISTIKRHDPRAVIVTFGDHGAWLTRGMKLKTATAPFDAEDYVQDLYGVMLAVYPQDFCRNRIFDGSTTSFMIRSLIECLNGNDNPMPEDLERNRSVYYGGKAVDPNEIVHPN
jgi:hypothetical protein